MIETAVEGISIESHRNFVRLLIRRFIGCLLKFVDLIIGTEMYQSRVRLENIKVVYATRESTYFHPPSSILMGVNVRCLCVPLGIFRGDGAVPHIT